MATTTTKLTTVRFRVPAVPVAQPKPHAVQFGGHARIHPLTSVKQADGTRRPHAILAFKASVRMAATAAYDGPPADEPLALYATFVMPRPKAKVWKSKPMERYPHSGKPDLDNLVKGLKDALSGILWRDDGLVCIEMLTKFVASGDEQPHVDVRVQTLTAIEQNAVPYEELTLNDFAAEAAEVK